MITSRLFEMLYLFVEKGSFTVGELAHYFEVSTRTVMRDVDRLILAGIPLYTTQGRGGGIHLMEGYVLNKIALSKKEQEEILLALQNQPHQNQNSQKLLQKLTALFQKPPAQWLEVDFSPWGQGEEENNKFNLLKTSIINQKNLFFTYISGYGEKSSRKVHPLKLVFKAKAWYLQAFDIEKKDYRTFRLSRILSPSTTGESFILEHFSPPPIENPKVSSKHLITLHLLFPPTAAFRVYDEFPQKAITPHKDGSLQVLSTMVEDDWVYSFLLSFGGQVKVISPKHVISTLEKMKKDSFFI